MCGYRFYLIEKYCFLIDWNKCENFLLFLVLCILRNILFDIGRCILVNVFEWFIE